MPEADRLVCHLSTDVIILAVMLTSSTSSRLRDGAVIQIFSALILELLQSIPLGSLRNFRLYDQHKARLVQQGRGNEGVLSPHPFHTGESNDTGGGFEIVLGGCGEGSYNLCWQLLAEVRC